MRNSKFVNGSLIIAAVLAAGSSFADVTMQQRVSVEAGGVMSLFSSESTVTSSISSDRSRTETQTESKSKLMGSIGGNLDTVSIMRLDKGLAWQLMPEKQQYSEMTFEQMRAQIQQSMQQLEEMQDSGGAGSLPVSEEDCQWSDPKTDVKETGEKQRFANIKAERHIITVQETCTVPDSGQTCVITWSMDNWMARRMPGDDETEDFNSALAEQLGTGEMMSGAQAATLPLMSMFKEGWKEALEEVGEIRGYPVKTVMQMEMGGENCTAMSGQPIAMDDLWSNALDAGLDAAAQSAGAHAGQMIAQETAEAVGDSVGGSVAGSAVGAASGEVISGLLSRFGKKKKKKAEPPPEAAPAEAVTEANPAAGSVVLFRVTSELIGFDDDNVAAERFELPAGWEKVSRN
jgi:hypothetical protein